MKNILIFLFGVGCGAAGTFIWLRKDIKKKLEEAKKEEDLPFEMNSDGGNSSASVDAKDENADKVTINAAQNTPEAVKEQTRIAYNNIIQQVQNGENLREGPPVPVPPRDENGGIDESENENVASEAPEVEERRRDIFKEIDKNEFMYDNEYTKDRLVYFSGDRIMTTENGTILTNPYLLVGNQWEPLIGKYEEHTAFIRNERLATDYEIFVENGTYADEYGYGDT